ncbi:MAG: glycoside hydrolase family 43 protein [Bacteroidales bacterium]|nr:glycoside hydrolase family 43 protein [Bacteroidales bacterium]
MVKHFVLSALSVLAALTFISCSNAPKKQAETTWEIEDEKVPLADPYILLHDGVYYAYGTGEPGFRIYTSTDLEHWQKKGIALDIDKCWGTKQFWAPEVYYIKSKDKFFIFYSSEEHICVATSDSPEGPFTQDEMKPIREEKGIDTSLYIDDDGTPYLYFVRFTGGNVIWVAEMTDDLLGIKDETLTECISAVEPWEMVDSKVTEGPSVFKIKDKYYMIYSANHTRSHDYAVGYATASSPYGPWEKYSGNPVLRRDSPNADGLVGTGHGAPFKDKDGKSMYVFHAHQNDSTMYPRTMYIDTELKIAKDGTLSMPGTVIHPVVVK